MKIAVLGANGFLGRYITQHLVTGGYTVLPVTRSVMDLTDYATVTQWLKDNEPYAVINCATAGGKQRMGDAVLDDVQNNINVFLNFFNNSEYFVKFINIGSGSEFDIATNIDQVSETALLTAFPKDSYGYSKNVIARMSLTHPRFYTLRLFGCFDKTDPDFRLFKKFLNGEITEIADRQFDYFSARDLCTVIEYYLNNHVLYRDVNCVYRDKLYLSEILGKFKPVMITSINERNYTGDGTLLSGFNLDLDGLDKSIRDYQ